MSSDLAVGVLGSFEVRRDGDLVELTSRTQRRILALLALHAGERVTRDRLVDVLWADNPPANAVASLQNQVGRIRALLGAKAIRSNAGGYALGAGRGVVDAFLFELRIGNADADLRILEEALRLWRGRPFDEFADEDWARPTVVRLSELHAVACERRVEALLAAGRVDEAVGHAEGMCAHSPLRERSHGLLIHALGSQGRAAEALRVFDAFRKRLVRQTGMEPSPMLRTVERDVLAQTSDAGSQELGTDSSPITVESTSLIGRDRAVRESLALLSGAPLVTLTGPGGIGKTRLAIRIAHELAPTFADGVVVVDLASLADQRLVGSSIAVAVGAMVAMGDPIANTVARLASRQTLLVLDNCEHVIDEAARAAKAIRDGCRDVSGLATSREPLGVSGEQVYTVEPLGPEAVTLFVQRAALVRHGFTLTPDNRPTIATICARLDGMPLAIELAAARCAHLTVDDLATQLDARPFHVLRGGTRAADPRHRGLGAAIDWSWNLLDAPEQAVLARLSVFVGGCTLDAARAVCGQDEGEAVEMLDRIGSLVRKSLVVADLDERGARYRLLETLRIYAADRLAQSGETDSTRRRHAEWTAGTLAEIVGQLATDREPAAARRRDIEAANLNAGIRWALSSGDLELAMRCLQPLGEDPVPGQLQAFREHFDVGLSLPGATDHPAAPWLWALRALSLLGRDAAACGAAADTACAFDAPMRIHFRAQATAALASLLFGGDASPLLDQMRRRADGTDDHLVRSRLALVEGQACPPGSDDQYRFLDHALDEAERSGVPSAQAPSRRVRL